MRPSPPALAVALLVGASTIARYAAARRLEVPWIGPDEVLYGLIGESLWTDGTLGIRGHPAPYYSLLTPALVGAPLAARGLEGGVELAQLLQCAAMGSAAVPVYLWARRLGTPWWGVAAAALTLAAPVLVYGELLMTEALFYPASAWALFALAGALERPTPLRQGTFLAAVTLAAAVRMQALVLLLAFALAAVLYDRQRPGTGRLRGVLPLTAGIALAALGVVALRILAPTAVGSTDLLGAYATLGTTTSLGAGLPSMIQWHLGAVALVGGLVPFVATALLAIEAQRGRVASAGAGAAAAAVAAYLPLLAAQVGVFGAGRLDHVAQRYLVSAVPAVAIGLVAWVAAGAPRTRGSIAAAGLLTVGLVGTVPVQRLVPAHARHDLLPTSVLLHLDGQPVVARALVIGLALAAVGLVALLPRRRLGVAALVVVAGLAVASVDASRTAERLSARQALDAPGGADPRWLDRADLGPATLLVTGDWSDDAVARTVFWNRSVVQVLRFPDVPVGVPPTSPVVALDPATGLVRRADGTAARPALVVAPASYRLDGEVVGGTALGSATAPAPVVWRLDGPLRIVSVASGLLPNGDLAGEATVVVPACAPGRLELTLIGKSGDPIDVRVDGEPGAPIGAAPGATPTVAIPAPPTADGTRPCTFALRTGGLTGTTRIAFIRSA